jgi:hypothetical protein
VIIVKTPARPGGLPGCTLKIAKLQKGMGKQSCLSGQDLARAGRPSLSAAGFDGPDFVRSAAVAHLGFWLTDIDRLASGMKIPARDGFHLVAGPFTPWLRAKSRYKLKRLARLFKNHGNRVILKSWF